MATLEHDLDVPQPSEIGEVLDPKGEKRVQIEKEIVSLKEICLTLTNSQHRNLNKFPGAHPVSLTREYLEHTLKPEADKYVVCEKTDGVRYLLLLLSRGTYLVDRKYVFTKVKVVFPLPAGEKVGNKWLHHKTLLDGELVVDKLPHSGEKRLRYLAYDILSDNGQSLLDLNFADRLLSLQSRIIAPQLEWLQHRKPANFTPPFEVKLKQMYRCRDVQYVLETVLPSLPHGNDGLIFTPVDQPYKAGTDENLFKWKPPYLNSVDFELNRQRGYYTLNIYDQGKPVFEDWVSVPQELKSKLESSQFQLPVIVECVRDPAMDVLVPNTESYNKLDETVRKGGWKIIRMRDDKMRPNENQ